MISSQAYGQTAIGQCAGIGDEGNFKIFIDSDTSTRDFRIYVDGVEVDTMLSGADFISEDIPFVDGTKSYKVTLRNIVNLNDSVQFIVHEVLCTDISDDGTMDFNTADCDYTKPLGTGGAIVSTVAPFNSDHVYLYVLTDSSGSFTAAPTTNYSGHFEDLSDGEYRVSAYHFLDTTDAQGFVTGLGTNDDIDNFSSMSNPVCYNFCGSQNYTVECECIVSIDENPSDETTCANESAEFYVVTSLTEDVENSSFTYSWEESTDDGSTFTPITPAETDSTLTIDPAAAADSGYQYRVIVTLEVSSVVICRDTSSAGILNVDPLPELATDLNLTVCSNEAIGITLAVGPGSVAATAYNIVSIDSALLIPSAGGSSTGITSNALEIANDAWTNTTGSVVTVTYQVAPQSADGCVGDTVAVEVDIDPEPVFASTMTASVCSDVAIGENIPFIDDNSLVIDSVDIVVVIGDSLSGTSFVGAGATGITSITFIAADEFTNTTSVIDSVVYTITPYAGACEGDSYDIMVYITPEPVGSDPELMVCSDEAFTIDLSTLITNGAAVDSFTWIAATNDSIIGESSTLQETSTITQTLTNLTGGIDSIVYTVTPQSKSGSSGCKGDPFTVTVIVKPEPVADDEVVTVCSEEALDIVLIDNITNGITVKGFIYTVDNAEGTARTDTSDGNIVDMFTNTSGSDITVIYMVTPITNEDCIGDPFTVTVTIESEPVLATDLDTKVCSQSAIGVTLAVDDSSVAADSFNIVSITAVGLSADVGNANTGIYADITTISNDSYTNTSSDSLLVTYAIAPISASGCVGDTVDVIVTIDPEAVVDAGAEETVCSNGEVDLSAKGSISGGSTTGTWSTGGDGTFDGGDTEFGTAAAYKPGPNDIASGSVILVLTSDEPDGLCPEESDSVVITINDVECSEFPWSGN